MKKPAITERQMAILTQSGDTRRAVGRLLNWLVAEVERRSAGCRLKSRELFARAQRTLDEVDVTRFEDDDAFLRQLLTEALGDY
jgi:hypothetical protein